MSTLQIPPYRAALLTNADGSPVIRAGANGDGDPIATERQWYMFWENAAKAINDGGLKLAELDGLVDYGNHEDRPDPEFATDGALYVEWDRGSVIYQNQGGTWQYIAGTMYGTLVPDQRPADLDPAADAGFQFRTSTDPARAFVWSGTAWIETTPIRYGTHAERLAETIANLVSGMLWMETDRGEAIYQNQAGTWIYVAGTMTGTISPDQRPAGLGVNDTGFRFETTDGTQAYRWSGTAWTSLTPAAPPTPPLDNLALLVKASASLTLTTSPVDIPGCTLTLARAGKYLVIGVYYFTLTSIDAGATLVGRFSGDTSYVAALSDLITGTTTVQISATVSQQWLYTATAGAVVTLQAYKSAGTGTSSVSGNHTTMMALWVSP
jgi:hypothetical protein